MVKTPPQAMTLSQFLAGSETKPASEFSQGKIYQKPMPQGEHSRLQQKLTAAINAVVEDQKMALALPELRCSFGERSIVPDIAVFLWERLPTREDGTIANAFLSHPDCTLEILSPEQSATRVTDNILHCLKHGTQMGWLIDPTERLVLVYLPQQQPEIFQSATDSLPVPEWASSLQITAAQLFDWLQIG